MGSQGSRADTADDINQITFVIECTPKAGGEKVGDLLEISTICLIDNLVFWHLWLCCEFGIVGLLILIILELPSSTVLYLGLLPLGSQGPEHNIR